MMIVAALSGCGASPAPPGGLTAPDAAAPPDLLPPPQIGPAGRADQAPNIDGVDRTYILDVPQATVTAMATGPVPLLIALHGAGDTADHFYTALALDKLAALHTFAVAVPDGWGNAWFVQKAEGWPGDDGQPNGLLNDIHLVQEIIRATSAAYYIDPKRLYVVGFSRGAAMTGLLAMASQNPIVDKGHYVSPFAAYGITSGYNAFGASGVVDISKSGPHRPLWILHGDADATVDISSGQQLADDLTGAGWPVTFTPVAGAPHTWLWQARYGQSNEDLWSFFAKNPIP